MANMNIAIDVRCLMHGRYAGVAEYAYQLLDNLLKIDRQNQYWLFYNSYSPVDLPKFPYANAHYCGFRFPNRLLMLMLKIFKYPKLDVLVAKAYLPPGQRIDLFFLPNLEFAAFSRQVKVVLTVHDLSNEIFPQFFSFKSRCWQRLINLPKLCRRAQKLIAVSRHTKEDLLKIYQLEPQKISMIHSGIASSFKPLQREVCRSRVAKKYGLPDEFILGLGTIEPRKNWESLIKAYDYAKEKFNLPQHLVIAGSVGWLNKKIFAAAATSKFKEQIHFIKPVQPKDRAALYNLADLFVYPSWYEGFGFPPLEAMACQVPTICSNVSSLPEITQGAAYLINPDHVLQIGQAIGNVLTDEALNEKLIELSRVQAEKFSWPLAAQKTLEIFLDLKNN